MDLLSQREQELVEMARNYRNRAYAPYSGFRVGAAVLTADGLIFGGCNIENASFGATNCAERTAIFKSVSEGHQNIFAVAIAGDGDEYLYPCGICRQVMVEFGEDILVLLINGQGSIRRASVAELLPHSFTKNDLGEDTHGI